MIVITITAIQTIKIIVVKLIMAATPALDLFEQKVNNFKAYILKEFAENDPTLVDYAKQLPSDQVKKFVNLFAIPLLQDGRLEKLKTHVESIKLWDHSVIPLQMYFADDHEPCQLARAFTDCIPALALPFYWQYEDTPMTKSQLITLIRYIECFATILSQ